MWLKEADIMDEVSYAYEEAHKDYEKRKIEAINHLQTIIDVYGLHISPTAVKWLKQAIEFMKEKEI